MYHELRRHLDIDQRQIEVNAKKSVQVEILVCRGKNHIIKKKILEKESIEGILVLGSQLTRAGQTATLTGTKTITWKLHDLAVTVKGRLPDGKKIIQY